MNIDLVIDYRKVATELAQRGIDAIITGSGHLIKEYWARYRNRDASTYADYLVRKGAHADAVRNFIYDTKSASLYDIYVPTMIKWFLRDATRQDHYAARATDYEQRTGDQLIKTLCKPVYDADEHDDNPALMPAKTEKQKLRPRPIAIVGNAGTGKSLFMKHAFFELQKLDSNRIPILIEVRSFNRVPLATFETRIYEEFRDIGTRITREQVANGLSSGLFVILLDGMDELKGAIQSHYETDLSRFAERYPACPILVSSRPSERVQSWGFDVRPIAPLELPAAEALIEKLAFDARVKRSFIELLQEGLFRSHYELASVPLLCTITAVRLIAEQIQSLIVHHRSGTVDCLQDQ